MEAENVSTILHLKENYRVQEDLRSIYIVT